MIRKLLVAAVVLAIVVAGGLYLVHGNLPKLVRAEIEAQGAKALGVAVRVRAAELQGEGPEPMIKLTGLTIANPAGYSNAAAIAIEDVWIRYDARPGQPAGRIVVREIVAAGVVVVYEGETGANNLETLQRNAIAAARAAAPGRDRESTRLFVDGFGTRPGQLRIAHKALPAPITAVLAPVGSGAIGRRENGAVAAEVAQRLVGAIVAEAQRGAIDAVQGRLDERPR